MLKLLLPAACLLAGCSEPESMKRYMTTDRGQNAFSHVIGNLDHNESDTFILGKSFFSKPWVAAPSATSARDGLGPLFSSNSCIACHRGNGAGVPSDKQGGVDRSLVGRLSLMTDHSDWHDGFSGDPVYGGQLSVNAIFGIRYEGALSREYEQKLGRYKDGSRYALQQPVFRVVQLQYGPLDPRTNLAVHRAQALIGLGLIEAIPDAEILAHEDIDDANGDGISGKANRVYSPETQTMRVGRFTWKAGAATVKDQVANAMIMDMGLTTSLYPQENCSPVQKACRQAPKGRHALDVPDRRLDAVTFYVSSLRVPEPQTFKHRAEAEQLFKAVGCSSCHIPTFLTQDGMEIAPYSDFLLHDMGKELSDGHSRFLAQPNEFRTAPLWGIGVQKKVNPKVGFLHDGRARTLEEAILWHGGEASGVIDRFKALSKEQRELLINWLKAL